MSLRPDPACDNNRQPWGRGMPSRIAWPVTAVAGLCVIAAWAMSARQWRRSPGIDVELTELAESRRVSSSLVPYPGTRQPAQILANIQAGIAPTGLASLMGMDEMREPTKSLRVSRILEVKSNDPAPGYLVVECTDLGGVALVNVAITSLGMMIGTEDLRGKNIPKPLSLSEAERRVGGRVGRIHSSAYVYFHNRAEPGSPLFRPLVAVSTDDGPVYLNSVGEVFAIDGGNLARPGSDGPVLTPAAPGSVRLKRLAQW